MEPWTPSDVNMPSDQISAAKRVHLVRYDGDWWWGHGKDESCTIEGTACHWFWLAYILIGLVDQKEAPYAEDKPLPFSKHWVQACVRACAGMADPEAEVAALKAAHKENSK